MQVIQLRCEGRHDIGPFVLSQQAETKTHEVTRANKAKTLPDHLTAPYNRINIQ